MIAIIITLVIALIAVNGILAVMFHALKAVRARYDQDMELAARLARAQVRQH